MARSMSFLKGPWMGTQRFLTQIPLITKTEACRSLGIAATEYQKYWKAAVLSDTLGLKRKSALTLGSMPGKSVPLIYRGSYIHGIKKIPGGHSSSIYLIGIFGGLTGGRNLVRVARAQEYGTIIKPRKAKALAIPVTAKARQYSPRNYPWKGGKPIFIPHPRSESSIGGFYVQENRAKADRRKRYRLVYLLVRQVRIPPRPAMHISWQQFRMRVPFFVVRGIRNEFKRKGTATFAWGSL